MKKILSFLLTIVFMQAQVFALSGGPTYAGAQPLNGSYAGVMTPISKTRLFQNPSIPGAPVASDANTLGIFVLTVPEVGAATGNFLYFDEGEAFFGTIQAIANPNTGEIKGLLAGAVTTNGNIGVIEYLTPLNAIGQLDAKVINSTGQNFSRIVGEAFIQNQAYLPDTSPSGYGLGVIREVTFLVDGIQQSAVSTSATSLSQPTTVPTVPAFSTATP